MNRLVGRSRSFVFRAAMAGTVLSSSTLGAWGQESCTCDTDPDCTPCCSVLSNALCSYPFSVGDPDFQKLWHIEAVRACEVWTFPGTLGFTGSGVVIGIVDWGIKETHPDLEGNLSPAWPVGCSEPRPPTGPPIPAAENAHGSGMAGICAAEADNAEGVAGIAFDATLAELNLWEDASPWNLAHFEQAWANDIAFLNDCIDIKICSFDLSGDGASGADYAHADAQLVIAPLVQAVETGRGGLGEVVVCSAGNAALYSGRTDYDELVSNRHTIAVGAIGSLGNGLYGHWIGSESGSSLHCVAPGETMYICWVDTGPFNRYICLDGTSFSAPSAGAVVALMLEANPNLSWRDVMEAIVQTAATIDPASGWFTNQAGINHSYEYGHGLIDAYEAVSFVTGTNGYPAWEPLLGERQVVVPLSPGGVQVGPGQTQTLTVAATANMRLEHVELLMDVSTSGALGIGPLEIEIVRVWPPIQRRGGGPPQSTDTESVFAVARADPSPAYDDALFTSVRHWGETGTATWKVRLRNTSDAKDPVTATWNGAELRLYGTPKCVADWNMDGVADALDDLDYNTDHANQEPFADLNHDQMIDPLDLLLWDTVYYPAGCP